MKKLFAAVLVLLLAVLCVAVPAFAKEAEAPAEAQTYQSVDGAIIELRNAMVNRESPVQVQFWSALPESAEIAQTVFYGAIEHTGVPTQGDYLYRHITNLKFNCETTPLQEGYLCTITYTVTYRTTAQQEAQVTAKVRQILDKLNVYDARDYDKILAIYKYLCDHTGTPVIAEGLDYTAYGALINKSAVCQGISSAFYRLALELGVDNRLLSGKISSVKHGWNIVAIDGRYYHADATKDAGFDPEDYHCFLKAQLPDHIRDDTYDTPEFHGNYPMGEKDYDPHIHTWDPGVVTTPATCVELGVMTYSCTGEQCEETYTEAIPILTTHLWDGGRVAQVATCAKEGQKIYTCTVPGCGKTREETLPKLTIHTWDSGVVTKPATCVELGVMTYSCTGEHCEETYTEAIPLLTTHAWDGGRVTTKATCKNTGQKTYTCTVPGCGKTRKETLSKLTTHSWDKGVTTKKATGYQEGVKTYTCTVCKKTKKETLPRSGWEYKSGKWYYHEKGKLATGWRKISGAWYYFDAKGVMKTGWQRINGSWYYMDSSGARKTGWITDGGKKYYLDSKGVMVTGTVTINGVKHKFDSSGAWKGEVKQTVKNGWKYESGKWYYYKNNVKQKGWITDGGKKYYLDSKGVMVTGTVTINGVKHKFDSSGAWKGEVKQTVKNGWKYESGNWYYYKNNVKQKGWLKDGGKWYYLKSNGVMATGWLKDGGTWYYLNSSGAMVTGSVKIGGKTYKFNSSGACLNP